MENLCVICVMFFAMTSISAFEMMHPYGPAMCRALETRYGRVTKYHPDNLTCVVGDDKTASANESCAEVIHNRKGEAVCIPVAEPRPPRLFLLSGADFYSIDIQSGTKMDRIEGPTVSYFMSCLNDEHKIYFYTHRNTLYSLDPHSRKIETLLKQDEEDVIGMAVDDTTKDVYNLFKRSVVKAKIGEDSVAHVFCDRLCKNNKHVAISPKRGLLFISTPQEIYSYKCTTKSRKLVIREHRIKDLEYDDDSDTLYFITKKYFKMISYKHSKQQAVLTSKHKLRQTAVYKNIVFLAGARGVSAVDITSKDEIWSQRKITLSEDMCILQ